MANGGGADEVHGLLKRHGIPLEHFKSVANDIHLITKIHVEKRKEIREKQGATRELSPEHRAALCDRLRKSALFSILLLIYVIAGGFIYSSVELPVEMDAAREFDETVNQLEVAAKLQDEGKFEELEDVNAAMAVAENKTDFSDDTGVLDPDSMTERMELVLEYAEDKSAAPSTTDGSYSWSRPSACFFALTIVTTIGYGSFAPATSFGKLFTIPFGTGGLILGGYTLSLVGSVITLGVELVIFKCFRKTVPDQVHLLASFGFFMLYMLTWALVFDILKEDPDWDYVEALYYCFITLTTIGFGDYVPDDRWLPVTVLFIFFGLGVVTSFIGNFVDVILRDLGEDDDLDDAAILDEIINELGNLNELTGTDAKPAGNGAAAAPVAAAVAAPVADGASTGSDTPPKGEGTPLIT